MALENPTCKDKEELAFRIDRPRIPVDGAWVESWVTKTDRNWYHPQMYFMAVMDCNDQMANMFGDNKYGRLEIRAEMTSDDDHFSYEYQGVLSTDSYLMVCYILLFVLNCKDWLRFKETEQFHSPHMYCLIAMGF